jgi:hypothetical protein
LAAALERALAESTSGVNYALMSGILAATCIVIALFLTDSQWAFILWLVLGIISALAADLLAWLQPVIWRFRQRNNPRH